MKDTIKNPWFLGFVGLMSLDAAITTLAYLFYSGPFTEKNPLFSQFSNNAGTFVGSIIISKIVAILLILGIILILYKINLPKYAEMGAKLSFCGMFIALVGLGMYNAFVLV